MTDELNRTCPHCGGKNTSYFIGIEETVWFTTKYETVDGFGIFACSDINRHKCPNLRKPELATAQLGNDTGGDARLRRANPWADAAGAACRRLRGRTGAAHALIGYA